MDDYISISTLNDFIFCPYSIYLHNVYVETDEGVYHATPQTRGRIAHETVDEKRTSNRADELQAKNEVRKDAPFTRSYTPSILRI